MKAGWVRHCQQYYLPPLPLLLPWLHYIALVLRCFYGMRHLALLKRYLGIGFYLSRTTGGGRSAISPALLYACGRHHRWATALTFLCGLAERAGNGVSSRWATGNGGRGRRGLEGVNLGGATGVKCGVKHGRGSWQRASLGA